MTENTPQYKAAEDQFRIMRKGIATTGETLSSQGQISLDTRAMIACLARLAERLKTAELTIKILKDEVQKLKTGDECV